MQIPLSHSRRRIGVPSTISFKIFRIHCDWITTDSKAGALEVYVPWSKPSKPRN